MSQIDLPATTTTGNKISLAAQVADPFMEFSTDIGARHASAFICHSVEQAFEGRERLFASESARPNALLR